jgi:parvulin-like peptidyl-prolyl isomerase
MMHRAGPPVRPMALACALILGFAAIAQPPDLENMDIVLKSVPDGPVARILGRSISSEVFKNLYQAQLSELARSRPDTAVTNQERLELVSLSLGILVQREVLHLEAGKRGLTITDPELEEAFERVNRRREQISGGAADDALLTSLNADDAATKDALRRSLLIGKARRAIGDDNGVTVTEEEVREKYEENRTSLRRPGAIHIKQIYVRAPLGDDPEKSKEERDIAHKRAEEALNRVLSGQRFETVAKAMSDSNADLGGDLGMTPVNALPPFLVTEARKLEPGGMSGVFESEYGYHILQLVAVTAGGEPTFEELAPAIRRGLYDARVDTAVREYCAPIVNQEGALEVYLELTKQIFLDRDTLSELSTE